MVKISSYQSVWLAKIFLSCRTKHHEFCEKVVTISYFSRRKKNLNKIQNNSQLQDQKACQTFGVICTLQVAKFAWPSRDRVRTGARAIHCTASLQHALRRQCSDPIRVLNLKVMMQKCGFPALKLAIFSEIYRQKSWEVIYLSKGM